MFDQRLGIDAQRIPMRNSVVLHFFRRISDYRYEVMSNIEFVEVDFEKDPVGAQEVGIEIPHATAQELMDALWDCGLRPSEGTGSAGALRAVERHRDDLMSIVDRLLDIVGHKNTAGGEP